MTVSSGDNCTQKNSIKTSIKSGQIKGCTDLMNRGTVYPGQSIDLKLQSTLYPVALYIDEAHHDDDMMPVCGPVHHSTLIKTTGQPGVHKLYHFVIHHKIKLLKMVYALSQNGYQ